MCAAYQSAVVRPHCTRCYFCMSGPQGYNVSCCLTQHIVSCNGISKGAKAPFRTIEHRICTIFLLSKQFSLHKCYLTSTPYLKPRAYSFHLYQRVLSPEVKNTYLTAILRREVLLMLTISFPCIVSLLIFNFAFSYTSGIRIKN